MRVFCRMMHYDLNRSWSDQYLPDIKRLVGSHLLSISPEPLDRTCATDLLTLDARDMRIAARIRRPGYAERFPHQFTIRSRVPSGAETELSKIVNGYGDWLFYGHVSPCQTKVERWWLIDLRAFRAALIRHANGGPRIVMGDQVNRDGTCFKWFDVRSFPAEPRLVVAKSMCEIG